MICIICSENIMEKNKVIILGTTMFSTQLCEILKAENVEIIGFTVDKAYMTSETFNGLPVYPFEELETYVYSKEVSILNTMGYMRMNDVRRQKHLECKSRGLSVFTFISKNAQVYTKEIGEGCIIMPGSYVGPVTKIGECCVVWPGAVLSHHNTIGDNCWIAPSCCLGGGAKVNRNCFFGLGSTIRNEIELAEYTFVGAHSYVGKDTVRGGAYVGVPAKLLSGKDAFEIVAKV